jgi:hypothetical protein
MRRLGVAVLTTALLLGLMWALPAAVAGGNVDAARACQQGGYLTLQGTDGTLFKNVGECVSHVARGGSITGVSASCSYTPGTSGCVEFDDVTLPMGTLGTTTTLAGMFTFAPPTDWPLWFTGSTAVSISGSGTWVTSTGLSGTWMATHASSIYPGTFYLYDTATGTSTVAQCGAANTRYVGVHFDVYKSGVLDGAIELQLRDATWGTNGVTYQGFTTGTAGEPYGLHSITSANGVPVPGVTLRC